MNNISTYLSMPVFITVLVVAGSIKAAPYAGFSLGQATLEDACDGLTGIPGVSCDDSDTAFKIFVGSKINENLAFEAAYVDMGESVATDTIDTLTSEATGFNFSALGIIPASSTVDIFGKVGLLFWDATVGLSGTFNASVDDDGTDITFGFGANFSVSETSEIRVEFEKFSNIGNESTTGETGVTLISLGAVLHF